MSEDALTTARAALERAQAARPNLDGTALTDATKALCAYRNEMRRDPASPFATGRLKTVNALISLIHAVHFPLGSVPWVLLDEARTQLDTLSKAKPSG